MPNNKAFGLDGLNVEIIKRSAIAISSYITNIQLMSPQDAKAIGKLFKSIKARLDYLQLYIVPIIVILTRL